MYHNKIFSKTVSLMNNFSSKVLNFQVKLFAVIE